MPVVPFKSIINQLSFAYFSLQQIYHIRSENNCNQLLSVQVEPSSSSGIDLPLDEESPPR